ncbi:MAG TPA: hypothetical protein VK327_17860 [Candidatus Paceibacterota bacterium]|nr:hypothetical protein [Candidatus Paceibacterota bacterium]
MSSQLLSVEEVARKISAGEPLVLAGEESLLAKLPAGKWIGGTIPYFMTAQGGCVCTDKIFTTELPSYVRDVRILNFSEASLPTMNSGAEAQDVSIIILPANAGVHTSFAVNAPNYEGFATHPVIGWISGVNLKDVATATPKVFCGDSRPLANAAVVLRFRLPENKYANIGIINLFTQGTGDVIRFPKSGFTAEEVLVNGKSCNFAEYLAKIGADTKFPVVANYSGASINVSFKNVDQASRRVEFYAPVWPDVDYKLAAPIGDYVTGFQSRLKELSPTSVVFSCNCILNYLYGGLEGRKTGGIVGPVTFGEIAYQLLNQTMAHMTIEDAG